MAKESELGKHFWLWALGVGAAVVAGIVVVFLLIHGAWYRWGAFGTLIFFFVVILVVAWFYDKHQVKQYYDEPGI